jgi:anti-anti-sigma regulatory factor
LEIAEMLKITQRRMDTQAVVVKLDGKLLQPWVDEFKASIAEAGSTERSIQLDLSALTFADSVGLAALADQIRQGAKVTSCSGYIAALLLVEKS